MSGPQGLRIAELVERAHPRRIARHADDWERSAQVLEEAAERIDAIAARNTEIGGRTGPSMAMAMARASDALRIKSRELRSGSDALAQIAETTLAHQEEKRRIDREEPDDGQHVVAREQRAGWVADGQESALRHGIRVMRRIDVGDDPRRTPIATTTHHPLPPPSVDWWPRPTPFPQPPVDPIVDDTDDDWWDDDDVDGPVTGGPGAAAPGLPGSLGSSPSSLTHAALGGAALLGGAGALAGARAVARGGTPGSAAPRIGGSGASGSGGVLGRSGTSGSVGSAGGGAGGRGSTPRGSTPGAGAGAGRGRGAATGGAGGAGAGGRGGRRRRDEREQGDRDLHDDGDGWLDDDAGPSVLR